MDPETNTADDTRRQMKDRFDAANARSKSGRQDRQDAADAVVVTRVDKRWQTPVAQAEAVDDVGENESSGG